MEKKTKGVKFFIQRYADPNDPTSTQNEYIQEIQVSSENCFSIYDYDKIERGNLITRFKDICEFKYTYTFPDEGLSPNGQILSSYSFSFYPLDLAGNVPVKTPNSGTALRPNINYGEKGLFCSVGAIPQSPDATCLLTNSLFKPTTINSNLYYNETNIVGGDNYTTIGSIYSETLTLYHDTQPPETNNLNDIRSNFYNGTIVDFVGEATTSPAPVTRDTTIDITATSERLSDRLFTLTNPKGTKQDLSTTKITTEWDQANSLKVRSGTPAVPNTPSNSTLLARSSYEGKTELENLPLGKNERDDSKLETCTTISNSPIVGRRIGTCEDGNYTLGYKAGDSAGNMTGEKTQVVERDTVRPDAPIVTANPVGDKRNQRLAIDLSGEAFTTAVIEVTPTSGRNAGKTHYQDISIPSNGQYKTKDLLKKLLDCGNITYVIKITLVDRAENISQTVQTSVTTDECLYCMSGNEDGWQNPIQDPNVTVSSGYRTSQRPNHNGTDLVLSTGPGKIAGSPIYPAKLGTVTRVWYQNSGFGHTVYIDHGDGYTTWYAHMISTPLVKVGQTVDYNTVLGYVGMSGGISSGHHLHFAIRYRGDFINPESKINLKGTNGTTAEVATYCTITDQGNGGEEWKNAVLDPVVIDLEYRELNDVTQLKNYTLQPNPILFEAVKSNTSNDVTVKGIGIYKHVQATLNIDYTYTYEKKFSFCDNGDSRLRFPFTMIPSNLCQKTDIQSKQINIDHTRTKITKNNRALREFWNDTSGDYNYKDDEGEILSGGRFITNGQLPGNSSRLINDKEVYLGDQLCSQSQIFTSFEIDVVGKGKKQIDLDGLQTVVGGCTVVSEGSDIEKSFYVSNDNPNWTIDSSMIRIGVNPNIRGINFTLHSTNRLNSNGTRIKNKYDGNSQVWIVAHGWYNNPNGDKCWNSNYMKSLNSDGKNGGCEDTIYQTAQRIKEAKPNDIVLLLDWREASGYGTGNPTQVNNAAMWITPTAREVKNKLNSWGLNDGQKINFVGHSLGTLMSAEIAEQFGGGNTAYLLDPASQLTLEGESLLRNYDLDGNTNGVQSALGKDVDGYFRNRFNFSRSFVGSNSAGGSNQLSRTSHEAFTLDFGSLFDLGKEHFEVIETFDRINRDTKIYNNYLDLNNMYRQSDEFGTDTVNSIFEGKFVIRKRDQENRNYTEFVFSHAGGAARYYGTEKDNIIDYSKLEHRYSGDNATINAGGGGDIVDVFIYKYTSFMDFNDGGDRIRMPLDKFNSDVINNGSNVIIREPWWGHYVTVHGSRRGEVTKIELKNAIRGDRTIFDIR
jgi:pimeloyl-ACP methyl ester carboxylesterase